MRAARRLVQGRGGEGEGEDEGKTDEREKREEKRKVKMGKSHFVTETRLFM